MSISFYDESGTIIGYKSINSIRIKNEKNLNPWRHVEMPG